MLTDQTQDFMFTLTRLYDDFVRHSAGLDSTAAAQRSYFTEDHARKLITALAQVTADITPVNFCGHTTLLAWEDFVPPDFSS